MYFRSILRENGCLEVLLQQLKSPSLTIVSNACGTLWNFSARSSEDQQALWDMGAVPMLKSLTNSKHKTISTCSLAALKNLYAACPAGEPSASGGDDVKGKSLVARKRKNLVRELDDKLMTAQTNEHDEDLESSQSSSSSFEDKEPSYPSASTSQMQSQQQHQPMFQQPDQGYGRYFLQFQQPTTDYNELMTPSKLPQLSFNATTSSPLFNQSRPDDDDKDDEERPTDYSLRFQENDEADLMCAARGAVTGNDTKSKVDDEERRSYDAVKTYYTEGTPYDTPFVVSNAGSISDLREKPKPSIADDDDDDIPDERPRTFGISGTETPMSNGDRPQVYCTEDTPGVFSRADSLSSLESSDLGEGQPSAAQRQQVILQGLQSIEESGEEKGQLEATQGEKEKKMEEPGTPPEPKTPATRGGGGHIHSHHKQVTFHPHETPLMFSRASSFESLNSFDQQSIRDGYSSCDFSRATSGRVSPSDLPDSPCQSPPLSLKKAATARPPHAVAAQASSFPSFSSAMKPCTPNDKFREKATDRTINNGPTTNAEETTATAAVVSGDNEDTVKKYNEEGTPACFSGRTSISRLTFSDEESLENQPAAAAIKPLQVKVSYWIRSNLCTFYAFFILLEKKICKTATKFHFLILILILIFE